MEVTTSVAKLGPAHFNQVGQRLWHPVIDLPESITAGLASRLHNYAKNRCVEAGFGPIVDVASVELYTVDGDERPSNRSYCVRFRTPQGGCIEVVGILTRQGWPSLDHGFEISAK